MFLKAEYGLESSVRSRKLWPPSKASSHFFSERSASELRPGDPPVPVREPGLVLGDEISPVRLSVRPRLVSILGLLSRIGRSQSMTGGHPPNRHLLS